ncbi:hypothetical protein B0H19DRAFT_1078937 [Mycena capillaripes]|nr:hypothetical protein B0H19DRAFT_1078937 [Mycena capillaripes]
MPPSRTTPQGPKSNTQPTGRRFTVRRRRTIMACSYCRRRKIRCITTEQPPRNPCAYCTRKHLTCEYVAVVGADGYSESPTASPDLPVAELPDSSTASSSSPSPPLWTPPVTSATFSPRPHATPPLAHPRPLDRNTAYFNPSHLPPMATTLSIPASFHERMNGSDPLRLTGMPPGYFLSAHGVGHHSHRPHPGHRGKTHAYNIQAAHALQYLSMRTDSFHPHHSTPSASPSPDSEYFADYIQMPTFGDASIPDYDWPPELRILQ